MARLKKLRDPELVRVVVERFILDEKPTISGLLISLDLKHLTTLHAYMAGKDEIADLITTAYLHIVYSHEVRMYEKSATGSIFYLKTLKKCGFNFRDDLTGDNDDKGTNKKSNKLTIEVVGIGQKSVAGKKDA